MPRPFDSLAHVSRRRRRRRRPDERGDVPGWVLITIMTISMGMAIWTMARPQLVGMLESALSSVK